MTIMATVLNREEGFLIWMCKVFGSSMLRRKKMQRKRRYDGEALCDDTICHVYLSTNESQ